MTIVARVNCTGSAAAAAHSQRRPPLRPQVQITQRTSGIATSVTAFSPFSAQSDMDHSTRPFDSKCAQWLRATTSCGHILTLSIVVGTKLLQRLWPCNNSARNEIHVGGITGYFGPERTKLDFFHTASLALWECQCWIAGTSFRS